MYKEEYINNPYMYAFWILSEISLSDTECPEVTDTSEYEEEWAILISELKTKALDYKIGDKTEDTLAYSLDGSLCTSITKLEAMIEDLKYIRSSCFSIKNDMIQDEKF